AVRVSRVDRGALACRQSLRRPAAGDLELRELYAAALRDQRARIGSHGLRRRRWHRPGPDRGDSQVLLLRRLGHPAADPDHCRHHRHPDVAHPPSPDRPGGAVVIRRDVDPGRLRDRYPKHFASFPRDRALGLSVAALAVLVLLWGMIDLGFFSDKLLGGGGRLLEIVGLMLPPDPGSWGHARTFAIALL